MPPNPAASPPMDLEAVGRDAKPSRVAPPAQDEADYKLKIFQSSMNGLAHICIGVIVGTAVLFAFRTSPLNVTSGHIIICVLGYQLLMAEAILSMSSENGWSSRLRFIDKRRAHWVLQILGSGLAIGGSFYKIMDKTVHWDSNHGRFALTALVCTTFSLFNGIASLWAYEFRGVLPGNLSKLTHVCTGTLAFSMAGVTLCYGLQKAVFTNWSSPGLANFATSIVCIMTFIVIINPIITFYNKSKTVIKNRSL